MAYGASIKMDRRAFLTSTAGVIATLIFREAQAKKAGLSRFVWDPTYSFNWTHLPPYSWLTSGNVVPVDKFQKLHDSFPLSQQFRLPIKLTTEDITRVHNGKYVEHLDQLAKTGIGILNGENPVTPQINAFVQAACAGTYTAGLISLQEGMSMNLSGGFHHAFPNHEEGFCYLNDVAIAIKRLQSEKVIRKAMIIDCDVHHGNGNAYIFLGEENVFIFDIYQEDNHYPSKSNRFEPDFKANLKASDGITNTIYQEVLAQNLDREIARFKPDIVFYLAGADPYKEDQLGNFQLTIDGLKKRDEYIINKLRHHRIPTTVVLAGGYAKNIEDVVAIHYNTAVMVHQI